MRSMGRHANAGRSLRLPSIVLMALLPVGCAFVPKPNIRLDEAHRAVAAARADTLVTRLASAELRRAEELLERATIARDTLDDPAEVDHLAYLAKQHTAIAREAAKQNAAR